MAEGQRLDAVVTDLSPAEVAAAFTEAARRMIPEANAQLVATLLAHSALETGNWKAQDGEGGMRCYNFGNVKATDKWIAGGGDYTYYFASELLDGQQAFLALSKTAPRTDGEGLNVKATGTRGNRQWISFWPDHPQCRFRAFTTAADGAAAYIRKLAGRYRSALKHGIAGKPGEYVAAIRALGYFTAPLDAYRRTVEQRYYHYLPLAHEAWQKALDQAAIDSAGAQAPKPGVGLEIDYNTGTVRLRTVGAPILTPADLHVLAVEIQAIQYALEKGICLEHDSVFFANGATTKMRRFNHDWQRALTPELSR
jgi:hypothetical protein